MRTAIHRSRAGRLCLATALLVLVAACVARRPQVTTTFVAPGAGPPRFQRTAAIFAVDDTMLRRRVEDRLAKRLPNVSPSYRLLSMDRMMDTADVHAALTQAGFDGVIVLRLLGVQSTTAGATGSSTPSEDLWAYLQRTPRAALTPGQQTVITMDSRVYSVADGKLWWEGLSRSFNPVSLNELVDMLIDATVDEVRDQRRFF